MEINQYAGIDTDKRKEHAKNNEFRLTIHDFDVSDDVANIFDSKIYHSNSELIYDIELYKFMSRDQRTL